MFPFVLSPVVRLLSLASDQYMSLFRRWFHIPVMVCIRERVDSDGAFGYVET